MNCYVCEKQPRPGGTRYHVRAAAGICDNCGVGVCAEHSYRAPAPGSPLLCPSCAKHLQDRASAQTEMRDPVAH